MIRVENAVLKKLGIRKSSENYYFLLDMIELINQNGEKVLYNEKYIYRAIAEKRGCNIAVVERKIRMMMLSFLKYNKALTKKSRTYILNSIQKYGKFLL
mgnify:FL=1